MAEPQVNGQTAAEEDDWERQFENDMAAIKTKNLQDIEDARKAGKEQFKQMRNKPKTEQEPESPIIAAVFGLIGLVVDWFRLVAMGWASLVVAIASAWIGIVAAISAGWIGAISTIASGWIDVISFVTLAFINMLQAVNNTALQFIE